MNATPTAASTSTRSSWRTPGRRKASKFRSTTIPSHPKKTGSLYAAADVAESPARDNEWFRLHVIVRGKRVVIKIDGKTVVDWTEPAGFVVRDPPWYSERKLSRGTFALQAHDPESRVCFKNLKVRPLVSWTPRSKAANWETTSPTARCGSIRPTPATSPMARPTADGSLRAVYLTGSHTWNNLVDMGATIRLQPFDFDAYLDFLERHNHNFIRLWALGTRVTGTRRPEPREGSRSSRLRTPPVGAHRAWRRPSTASRSSTLTKFDDGLLRPPSRTA